MHGKMLGTHLTLDSKPSIDNALNTAFVVALSNQVLLTAQGVNPEAYEQADWLRERKGLQLDHEIDEPCL